MSALLRPDIKMTLVEPLEKRVSFLRTVLGTIGRVDIKVQRTKGEDLVTKGTTFDCAVSRATLAPQEWLHLGTELAPKGRVFVLLAKIDDPEKAGWDKSAECHYQWPGSKGERWIVEYREHVGGH